MSYNTGIILKISHNCGAEKRTNRSFEIFFLYDTYALAKLF